MRHLNRTAARIRLLRRASRRSRVLRRLTAWGTAAVVAGVVVPALWITEGRSRVGPLVVQLTDAWLGTTSESGLVVQKLSSDGRVWTSVDDLRTVLDGLRGTNILAVDIDQTRRQIEELPWVKSASVHRRLPDTLHVSLTERQPLALAEGDQGRLVLIDQDGEPVEVRDLRPFRDLPTVAGDGAGRHAGDLLALIRTEPSLSKRVTGARRIGDRRWNVWIDGRIEVRLPDDHAADAWSKLAAIQAEQSLLDRAIVQIDMRAIGGIVVRQDPRVTREIRPGDARERV